MFVWTAVAIVSALLIIDWIIVMGVNPKNWKGGDKHGKR